MMKSLEVRRSFAASPDPKAAVLKLEKELMISNEQFSFLFCSANYNLEILGTELKNAFGNNVICCTTSGEISSEGYSNDSIVGASISSKNMKFHKYFIPDVADFDSVSARELHSTFLKDLENSSLHKAKYIGIVIIDGLSMKEDNIIAILSKTFENVEIVGGSSGDDLRFDKTYIYNDGEFLTNSAVFLIIETEVPYIAFNTQHFEPVDQKLVITDADPSNRIVYEINGEKAAIEYAKILGIEVNDLNPQFFARYPVMLNIGGNWYIRSIAKVNDDFSLTFFCAIDSGLVLTIAKGNDIIQNLKNKLFEIHSQIGEISLILVFDCILRRLEVEQKNLSKEMNKIFSKENIIGFNSYGEQCNFVHVNQTLTGVAFGK
ncbi:MAG: FIST N-terminal domain-containing protein [Ignavibacteria bacterium]